MTETFISRRLFDRRPSTEADATPVARTPRRFDRLGRLYGDESVDRLLGASVLVVGLGGVGSFAAEALTRSAIGRLMLVDFDAVCVTNINRQIQAVRGSVGRPKAEALRERLVAIHPQADIRAEQSFYSASRSADLLTSPWGGAYDFVLDCIDNLTAKAHLVATCRASGIPLISSMGAAAKVDPTRVRVSDLAQTSGCPMASRFRKILRSKYDFPRTGPFGVQAVYSDEPRRWPRELAYDVGQGFRCVCPHKSPEHRCDDRSLIDGTAVFVTGAFGLAMASRVVDAIAEREVRRAKPAPDRRGYRPDDEEPTR